MDLLMFLRGWQEKSKQAKTKTQNRLTLDLPYQLFSDLFSPGCCWDQVSLDYWRHCAISPEGKTPHCAFPIVSTHVSLKTCIFPKFIPHQPKPNHSPKWDSLWLIVGRRFCQQNRKLIASGIYFSSQTNELALMEHLANQTLCRC